MSAEPHKGFCKAMNCETVGYVSRLLGAVANPKRLMVFVKLLEGEQTVGELAEIVSISALGQDARDEPAECPKGRANVPLPACQWGYPQASEDA
jgi:hypothetical protein